MDHVHDHAHDHSHGHDHAHPHGHGHGAGDYYLEQLLTIGICAAFAVVAVMMYRGGTLDFVLVKEFHPWVLGGGIALFALTVVRAVALWRATAPKEHHHEHGPDCDHTHGADCGHDHAGHDHADHAHGSIFWKVVVLMFPVALFFMGLPNEGFSQERLGTILGKDAAVGNLKEVADKGGDVLPLSFADLAAAALDADSRSGYEGMRVRVKGQLRKLGDKECTLFYMKMTCCAADMVPLKARIVTDDSLGGFSDFEWREVTGVLQFAEVPGKNMYIPVIRTQLKNIVPTKAEQ